MASTKKPTSSTFPSQAVPDSEKRTMEYGLSVAKAIEQEWFATDRGIGRYEQNRETFHRLRLYARGEQSVRKYKDEFAVNGDLSYLNLDWKPVPIVPKFVDIVVNGMQDRIFRINAFAQDPISKSERVDYVRKIEADMAAKEQIAMIKDYLGVDTSNVPADQLPANTEELELYMQLEYKQAIEIAIEQAIENVFMRNKYRTDLKKRVDYDLTVIGIGAVKHTFNNTNGIELEYVDPANLIYSYTEDPNFEDVYYFGEVKTVKIGELKRKYPHLTDEELQDFGKQSNGWADYQSNRFDWEDSRDTNTVDVLYFNWKTWKSDVHKVKETSSGGLKALKKDDTFNPPKDQRSRFEKVSKTMETIYEGALVIGTKALLYWKEAENMVRPDSNTNKVMMNYAVAAPKMYKGRIESLVSRMITYADQIQLTHLKIQQVVQKMVPPGIWVNIDGLSEIDLGNGTSYNAQEALNLFFQTGSIVGRSMTADGDPNGGAIPIQELPGSSGQQIQLLIAAYQQYMQNIRDVTGLNEARDGSSPDQYSLVGVQKLAAANSNTATRHILYAGLSITSMLAECISVRFKDVMEFHPQKEAFIGAIGRFSVGALEELDKLHLHDFGIFLELEPDVEEKAILDANIQAAISQGAIHADDVLDIQDVKNIKLATKLLKLRRKKKQQEDQEMQQANLQAQSQSQAQGAIQVEQAKMKAKQMENQGMIQLEQVKGQLETQKLKQEEETKMRLMDHEFAINMKILQAQNAHADNRAREDAAAKLTGEKLKVDGAAQKVQAPFESKQNDTIGAIDLGKFEPK